MTEPTLASVVVQFVHVLNSTFDNMELKYYTDKQKIAIYEYCRKTNNCGIRKCN